jgi:hypothetical protein
VSDCVNRLCRIVKVCVGKCDVPAPDAPASSARTGGPRPLRRYGRDAGVVVCSVVAGCTDPVLIALSLSLSGCRERLYTLTAEEQMGRGLRKQTRGVGTL